MSNNVSETAKNTKTPKKKKKKIRIFRVFLLIILLICVVGAAVGFGLIFAVVKTAKPINANSIQNILDESSFIYDVDGNLIEKVHSVSTYRSVVPLEQIPKDLQNAVIAIEDERFYSHHGIDVKRIGGAIIYDIKTRSLAQGASTITMQLAKNLYTSSARDFSRKIKDAYYALEIEKQLSKDQILHIYLNTMGLGRGTNGVQAASQTYFSKDVSELNLAESAMIAGITKFPFKYSPFITAKIEGNEDLSTLQILVLPSNEDTPMPTEEDLALYNQLLSIGKIDKFEYNLLNKGDMYIRKAILNEDSKERQEVVLYKMLELGYIDQAQYDQAINEPIIINVGRKKEQGISSYFVDKLKKDVVAAFIKKGYTEDEANDILNNGGLRIYSTMDTSIQKILEEEFENSKNFQGSFVDNEGILQPQGAMVIMDNASGEVRGLVGGRGIGGDKIYNRALNPRQPGSSIKPIAVYLPALLKGYTAATVVDDAPREDGKGGYWPKNVGRYFGPSPIRTMIEHSSNVVAVKVAETFEGSEQAGIHAMINSLKNLGITTVVTRDQNSRVNDENLSLALGGMTKGLTPLEITAAYTVFSNQGTVNSPIFFTRVENSNGDVILENKSISKKIADEQTAYIMTDMLRTAVVRGSGASAQLNNMTVAGKTGTTNDQKDVWFVGFTPYFTAGTWIGTDMPQPLADGSTMSARLWKNVMQKVHAGYENKGFTKPSGIAEVSICKTSGLLLTEACIRAGTSYSEIFKAGTEPKEYCSIHNDETVPVEEPPSIDDDLFNPETPENPELPVTPENPGNETPNPNPPVENPVEPTDPENPETDPVFGG